MFVDPWQVIASCAVGDGDTIDVTDTIKQGKKFVSMSINWSGGVAPTTVENLTVKIDSAQGATYDVPINVVDPSTYGGGMHKYYWTPEPDMGPIILGVDDHINVDYANTDDLEIGLVLTFEAI